HGLAADARSGLEPPEVALVRAADARAVAACLAELPHEYREVGVLRELEGLAYKDIAAVVGVPIGTRMSRLPRRRRAPPPRARRTRRAAEEAVLSCARVHQVLDAYVDGELDPATVAELDEHLASCTACAALRAERLALGAEIRAAAAYHPAPPGLRATIERSLPRPERAASRRPSWTIAGALAAGAAVTGLAAGLFL